MTHRLSRLWPTPALLTSMLCACATSPPKFCRLDAAARGGFPALHRAPRRPPRLGVGPTAAGLFDRSEIVTRSGTNS
jgi:hypothetical protein